MKNIFEKLGIIAGSLCILGALIMTIAYGFTVGNFIALLIGGVLIGLALWFRKLPKFLRRMIGTLLILGLCFFVVLMTVVIIRGARDTVNYREDAVIVLGSGIRGETVLPTLQNRLDKCIEYHRVNPSVPIIVSGGQGHNEAISEAEAMKKYLVANGIPTSQIIMEDKSRNTHENFLYSKPILNSYFAGKPYTLACITSDYHIFRSEQIANKQNVRVHTLSAGIPLYLRPSAYTREFLSILKFWVLG